MPDYITSTFMSRFIMSLCIPMTQVLLHTIIEHLRADKNKVHKMADMCHQKWYKDTSVWIRMARVGLPVAYMLGACAIVVPGIANILVEGSSQ